jgi:hypothetical protein
MDELTLFLCRSLLSEAVAFFILPFLNWIISKEIMGDK